MIIRFLYSSEADHQPSVILLVLIKHSKGIELAFTDSEPGTATMTLLCFTAMSIQTVILRNHEVIFLVFESAGTLHLIAIDCEN